MMEHKVSAGAVTASLGWVAAFTLVIVEIFISAPLGHLGILIAGAVMVVQIKSYITIQASREEAAFKLGTRTAEHVRQLR